MPVKVKPSENGRQLDVKGLAQGEDISIIVLIRDVARVASHLEVSRLTPHGFAGDRPSSFERTYLEWEPRWPIHGHP